MLLSNRRVALIHLCVACMEAAWLTPFWLVIYRPAPPPWLAFGILLAGLLAWMLVLELLSRMLASPLYDLIALALMGIASLLVVRLVLYPGPPAYDLSWLGRMVGDAMRARDGFPPALGLIAATLVLWQRATAATSRDISFFNVGYTFRMGILLLVAGAALAAVMRGVSVLPLLFLHFFVGLIAVSVARIGEKASEAQNTGVIFPRRRFVQLLLAVGVTTGAAGLLASAYTPDAIGRFLHLFDPLWRFVRPLVLLLLALLGRLLNPLLLRLEAWLTRLLAQQAGSDGIFTSPLGSAAPQANPAEALPPWVLGFMDVLLVIFLVLAGLGAVVLLLLYLERVRKAGLADQPEEEGREPATFGGSILRRGLDRLRGAARLVGRFGLGGRLLAAVSVQNIYANLCRLASQRGHPRPPAQPPDDYLPTLRRTFPGHDAALARITAAYMRVHYGDHPVSMAELSGLRDDYRAVREGESAESQGK